MHRVPPPLIAAFALVAWFYVWTVTSDNLSWRFGSKQTDYYNLLVDGFLEGRLSLKAEVAKELLACADPYDPAQRPPGSTLHDASFYRGKYYIYYGIVPAVVLLLPFRLITGVHLPLAPAVLALVLVGYVFSLLILKEIRRRFFPECRGLLFFVLGVAVGLVSFAPILLRRHSMYELPIASGYAFSMAALFCTLSAVLHGERRTSWLALASLGWGLAIGSRPTYLLAPACLAFPLGRLLFGGARARNTAASRWKLAAVTLGPITTIGALLALYNFERFGDPFEFGVRYILSGVYESKVEHFSVRYLPWNLQAYFFAPGQWGRYFPFFHGAGMAAPLPSQHFGMDFPLGVLRCVPFLWLAGFLPLLWMRPANTRKQHDVRLVVMMMAWVAAATGGIVLCFYAAMARYLGDFAPTLALLACVGAMTLQHQASATGKIAARWAANPMTVGCAVVSLFTVSVVSIRLYDIVRKLNPALYQTMARAANAPVHWLERLRGAPLGAVTLQVQFPPGGPENSRETLIVTGWGRETDRVVVRYRDAGQVSFVFEHADAPPIESAAVTLDRAAVHTVRIAMGSLLPPSTDPVFDSLPAVARSKLLRWLRVECNGQVMLDRYQRTYDASSECIRIGDAGGANPFTGRLVGVARERFAASVSGVGPSALAAAVGLPRPDARGTLRLRVSFPTATVGEREPLLVTGETGRGDLLVVEYLAGNQLRFWLDHWGSSPRHSPPLDIVTGRDYRLEITHQAYATAVRANIGGTVATPLRIVLDGLTAWECPALLFPVEPDDFFVGWNPIGGSSCRERFSGAIAEGVDR